MGALCNPKLCTTGAQLQGAKPEQTDEARDCAKSTICGFGVMANLRALLSVPQMQNVRLTDVLNALLGLMGFVEIAA